MEEELPIIRKEVSIGLLLPHDGNVDLTLLLAQQPGLRLQQYKERLFKQFQKHPDNPFNQVTVGGLALPHVCSGPGRSPPFFSYRLTITRRRRTRSALSRVSSLSLLLSFAIPYP